jgi:hypothetical protein
MAVFGDLRAQKINCIDFILEPKHLPIPLSPYSTISLCPSWPMQSDSVLCGSFFDYLRKFLTTKHAKAAQSSIV